MNCERVQLSLLELHSGSLPATEAAEARDHLKTCLACQKEWADLQETLLHLDALPAPAPSPRLREQFQAMLARERLREMHPSTPALQAETPSLLDRWFGAVWPRRPSLQFAAILGLVAFGLLAGMRLVPAAPTPPDNSAQLLDTQRQLAELRAQVDSMNQLVAYSLSQREPARARLQQVAAQAGQTDEKALARLLSALAFDQSTNVRLSALEALYPHAGDTQVRNGVLVALPRESSPLVQVAMIDFLAASRAREAGPVFQQLARTPLTDQAVRSAAQRALAVLEGA